MAKKRPKKQTSDTFWQSRNSVRSHSSSKKQTFQASTFLYPIDNSNDCYDPFSDLSLFLAKKITKLINDKVCPAKWSDQACHIIEKNVLPEFRKQFPRSRIGNITLRKIFEKVLFYHEKMHTKKKAYKSDGSLDLEYMIQENLKNMPSYETLYQTQPYNQAHQLAIKISECVATLDGKKIPLESLTKTIWSTQRHLLPTNQQQNTPLEKHDLLDRLFIRNSLSITHKKPYIPQKELKQEILSLFSDYQALSRYSQIEQLKPAISSILANKVVSDLSLFRVFSRKKIDLMESFIVKQIKRCKEQKGKFTKENKASIVHRILALYPIAASLPKNSSKQQLDAAISYVYSLSSNIFAPISPVMNQAILSFINSEIVSLKEKKETGALEKVLSTLLTVFQDASELPTLNEKQQQELEAWIWHLINLEDHYIDKIPSDIYSVIDNEMSHIMVQKDKFDFKAIVHETLQFFKQLSSLEYFTSFFKIAKNEKLISKLEMKAYLCSIQNDMICALLDFNETMPMIKEIKKYMKKKPTLSLQETIQNATNHYIKYHPFLKANEQHLLIHFSIMYKYLWYKDSSCKQETTFHRFVKFHALELKNSEQYKKNAELYEAMQQYCIQALPLTPFESEGIKELSKDCI